MWKRKTKDSVFPQVRALSHPDTYGGISTVHTNVLNLARHPPYTAPRSHTAPHTHTSPHVYHNAPNSNTVARFWLELRFRETAHHQASRAVAVAVFELEQRVAVHAAGKARICAQGRRRAGRLNARTQGRRHAYARGRRRASAQAHSARGSPPHLHPPAQRLSSVSIPTHKVRALSPHHTGQGGASGQGGTVRYFTLLQSFS